MKRKERVFKVIPPQPTVEVRQFLPFLFVARPYGLPEDHPVVARVIQH